MKWGVFLLLIVGVYGLAMPSALAQASQTATAGGVATSKATSVAHPSRYRCVTGYSCAYKK